MRSLIRKTHHASTSAVGSEALALSLSSPGAGDSSKGLSAALPHSKITIIKIIKKK